MKQFKTILLVSFVFGVLMLGQPHAVVASTNSGGSGSITSDVLEAGDAGVFDVDILSQTYTNGTPLDAVDNAYLHYGGGSAPLAVLNISVSGHTTWNGQKHVGQLYSLHNGEMTSHGSGILSETTGWGFSLLPNDTNFITLFYVGKGQESGLVYDSETIVIHTVSVNDDSYGGMSLYTVPLEFDVSDRAEGNGALLNTTTTGLNFYSPGLIDKAAGFEPYADLNVTFEYEDFSAPLSTGSSSVDALKFDAGRFKVSGVVDTSGFDSEQIRPDGSGFRGSYAQFERTQGHIFYYDALGVHLYDGEGVTQTTVSDDPSTPFGVLVMSEFGRMNSDLVSDFGGTKDWEGLASSAHFGSFDFVVTQVGSYVTYTDTVQEPSTITNTSEEPGFGAVISLITVGAIAYVAPRFRKEE